MREHLADPYIFCPEFSFRQTLDGLNPNDVPNLDKAKLNVLRFVEEVFERLATEEGGRKEDEIKSTVAGAACPRCGE